jgi:hypothetical protein
MPGEPPATGTPFAPEGIEIEYAALGWKPVAA